MCPSIPPKRLISERNLISVVRASVGRIPLGGRLAEGIPVRFHSTLGFCNLLSPEKECAKHSGNSMPSCEISQFLSMTVLGLVPPSYLEGT